MYELMVTKKEDDEFVLQIAHSLLSLLACQATRTVLLQSTQVSLAQSDDMLPVQNCYLLMTAQLRMVAHEILAGPVQGNNTQLAVFNRY